MDSSSFLFDTTQGGFPRRVLLVQAPIGKSFQSIASALDWSTSAKGPVRVAIDWDSSDIDIIPTMKSHISFVRHFAVCLIDDDIWTKPTYTLLEKFMTARFWEHPGASSGSEAQQHNSTSWSEADIKQIDAIQEVGITRLNLNEIRENYYQDLFKDWSYLPLWWNCQDFAVRLAFLVVGEEAADISKWIMLQLRKLLVKEVTGKWNRVTVGGFLAGYVGFSAFWVAEAIVGVACPPLAILGAWSLCFGSGVTGSISQSINDAKLSEWWKRTIALEERFPQLQMIRLNE